jgi:hypothetical protein
MLMLHAVPSQDRHRLAIAACLIAAAVTGPACSDAPADKQPSAADRALADPMNYGPKPGRADTARRSADPPVRGDHAKPGDPASDREAFNRELKRVLDP